MPTYLVTIERMAWEQRTYHVTADNEEQAEDIANAAIERNRIDSIGGWVGTEMAVDEESRWEINGLEEEDGE